MKNLVTIINFDEIRDFPIQRAHGCWKCYHVYKDDWIPEIGDTFRVEVDWLKLETYNEIGACAHSIFQDK